jgi:hypothetical protein
MNRRRWIWWLTFQRTESVNGCSSLAGGRVWYRVSIGAERDRPQEVRRGQGKAKSKKTHQGPSHRLLDCYAGQLREAQIRLRYSPGKGNATLAWGTERGVFSHCNRWPQVTEHPSKPQLF